MRSYPTYRIEDFYSKSFREGGLTYQQFLCLHAMADEAAYNQNQFLAAIHGIDIAAPATKHSSPRPGQAPHSQKKSTTNGPMLFGDPEQYSHLSDEERKALTQKMLKHWKPMGDTMMASKKPEYHN